MEAIKRQKILAVGLFFLCGTISTLAYKLMGSQYVEEKGHSRHFFHPYMQSFTMFVGQALCLIAYLATRKKNPMPLEEGKQPHQFYIFALPALADSISSCLQYMGLNFIAGSTYLMFKGAAIVTTAIFSKILLNMVIQKRHLVGCGSAIIGLVIVGASGFLNSSSSDSQNNNQFLGYTFMLISLVFNGFFYAYQQYLMKKHTINPLQMVGCEGVFGMVIVTFIALILSISPCPFQENICVFDSFGNPYFERIDVFFAEVFTDGILFVLTLVGLVTVGLYNLNGVRITKLIDALTRSLLNITKTGIIWILGIIITLIAGDNPDYQIESKDPWVNVIKAAGFSFIIMGTLVYNKFICKKYLEGPVLVATDEVSSPLLRSSQSDEQGSGSSEQKKESVNA